MKYYRRCEACLGTGRVVADYAPVRIDCHFCFGTGRIERRPTLMERIFTPLIEAIMRRFLPMVRRK